MESKGGNDNLSSYAIGKVWVDNSVGEMKLFFWHTIRYEHSPEANYKTVLEWANNFRNPHVSKTYDTHKVWNSIEIYSL